MKKKILTAAFLLATPACITHQEMMPVVVDAARKAMACEPIAVTKVHSYRYEVTGCGQTTWWTCYGHRDDICCERVSDKQRLMRAVILLRHTDKVCEAIGAEVPLLSY